jgi:predicted transcriptional regulator
MVKVSAFALNMWSIEMNDKAMTATSLRMPDGLLRLVTKAAHKMEMSRTQYITDVLQAAVNKTLEIKNDTTTN